LPFVNSNKMIKRNIFFSLFFSATVLAFPISLFGFPEKDFYLLTNIKMVIFIAIIMLMVRAAGVGVSFFKFAKYKFDRRVLPACLLIVAYLAIQLNPREFIFNHQFAVVLLLFSAGLLGALAEELVFRVFISTNLYRAGFSPRRVIVVSSIFFSVIHTLNIFKFEYDLFSILNQLVFAFFVGLLLGSLYFITRSLLFVWIFHFLINIPGLLARLSPSENFGNEKELSLADNIVSSVIFLLLMSPLFIVSMYYLRKIGNNGRVSNENSSVDNVLLNT